MADTLSKEQLVAQKIWAREIIAKLLHEKGLDGCVFIPTSKQIKDDVLDEELADIRRKKGLRETTLDLTAKRTIDFPGMAGLDIANNIKNNISNVHDALREENIISESIPHIEERGRVLRLHIELNNHNLGSLQKLSDKQKAAEIVTGSHQETEVEKPSVSAHSIA